VRIVEIKSGAQSPRLNAYDGVRTGVVGVSASANFDADMVFLQISRLALQSFLKDIAEEMGETFRTKKRVARQDSLECFIDFVAQNGR
jgi:hypothetical protein